MGHRGQGGASPNGCRAGSPPERSGGPGASAQWDERQTLTCSSSGGPDSFWNENDMASDELVATALRAFAKALLQGLHNGAENGGLVSEQERVRGEQLKDLSERVQAMANNPQAATYLG